MSERQKFRLPESETIRMNRSEMQAARWSLVAADHLNTAGNELTKHLNAIPDGPARWSAMMDSLKSLMDDLVGTIPIKQCLNIKNTLGDMEIRMVPRLTPKGNRVCIGVQDLTYLVEAAKKDICTSCVFTGEECRQCELYKILESIALPQDWGDSTICPYNRKDWFDR